jgi:hypothetical protein
LGQAFPVSTLTNAMVQLAFRALLVAAIGPAALMQSGALTAGIAAIALSAVAMRAEKKDRVALHADARSQPDNDFASKRHAFPGGTGQRQALRVRLEHFLLVPSPEAATSEPRRFQRRGSLLFPPLRYITRVGRMTCAFGEMMSLRSSDV